MAVHRSLKGLVAGAGLTLLPLASAFAAGDPTGVWINDTGRGAIEIKPCGAALCGHVVWVKDPTDTKGCGRQIIGNAAKVGAGVWDNGWIYSPEKKQKYDVELKPLSNGTLQVTGYAGTKLFSKTMIWKPAPASLERCGKPEVIAKADPAAKLDAKPKTAPKADLKKEPKPEAKTKPAPKPASEPKAEAKAKDTIVPPAPTPAERPAARPPVPAPTEVARAEPEATPPPAAAPLPEAAPIPGVAEEAAASPPAPPAAASPDAEAAAKPAPDEPAAEPPAAENPVPEPGVAEDEPAPAKRFDMGKIAKKLAELERETGYGLKKTGDGNCRLNVPFATVNFPCKK